MDHILLVESPYMDLTDHIFWYEIQPQTHIPKPNLKPTSRKPNPKTLSPKPNPKPTFQTPSRTYIPKANPKPISPNLIPNPYP